MKMRWIVLIKVHRDDDPKKSAYFRHTLTRFIQSVSKPLTPACFSALFIDVVCADLYH
jgi:hypothetical protein